jgi:hypothetical protein
VIEGLVSISVGILAILCRKLIVRQRAAFNKYQFGAKYSALDLKYGEVIGFVVGVLFILFGLLAVLGVIKFQ